ncbi:Homeodomain-like protein [Cynara cardunculus var. scolymus]|uniref:Homeodomain-like protein n=1 Tax=Cynara cardunculus var. scolymus TaxID=59895 RepID=A0A103YKR1_CYNCS|nr:Homeodomain-like protein [Cynara cardunculus var. scolymus]
MLPVRYNLNLNRLSLNSSTLASRLAHGRTHEWNPIHDSRIEIAIGLDSIDSRSLPLSGLDYRPALGLSLSLSHLVACEVRRTILAVAALEGFWVLMARIGKQIRGATPKSVLELMDVKDLTLSHVKSHLQVYVIVLQTQSTRLGH